MCHQQIVPIKAPIFTGHTDLPFLGVLLHLSEQQEAVGSSALFRLLWSSLYCSLSMHSG